LNNFSLFKLLLQNYSIMRSTRRSADKPVETPVENSRPKRGVDKPETIAETSRPKRGAPVVEVPAPSKSKRGEKTIETPVETSRSKRGGEKEKAVEVVPAKKQKVTKETSPSKDVDSEEEVSSPPKKQKETSEKPESPEAVVEEVVSEDNSPAKKQKVDDEKPESPVPVVKEVVPEEDAPAVTITAPTSSVNEVEVLEAVVDSSKASETSVDTNVKETTATNIAPETDSSTTSTTTVPPSVSIKPKEKPKSKPKDKVKGKAKEKAKIKAKDKKKTKETVVEKVKPKAKAKEVPVDIDALGHWSESAEQQLNDFIEHYRNQGFSGPMMWELIASKCDYGFTAEQCMSKYYRDKTRERYRAEGKKRKEPTVDSSAKKWDEEGTLRLNAAVDSIKAQNYEGSKLWSLVSETLDGKWSGAQCMNKYYRDKLKLQKAEKN